ncbi:MAG TPA: trypsin-like peptidase domain-containing protein [Candidatus Paceibacterota bacterium]
MGAVDFLYKKVYPKFRCFLRLKMNRFPIFFLLFLFFVLIPNDFLFAEDPYGFIVVVDSHCDFKARPLGSLEPFEYFETDTSGIGFFVGHKKHDTNNSEVREFIVSAGHIVNCQMILSSDFFGFEIKEFEAEHTIFYNGVTYFAKVLKSTDSQRYFEYPDEALLETFFLKSLKHSHLNLSDSAEKYKVGDKATIRGFFVLSKSNDSTGWRTINIEADIAFVNKNFIQLSVQVYPGMSGSPIIFYKKRFLWWGKKPVVIGILSLSDMRNGYVMPSAWASKVNKRILK